MYKTKKQISLVGCLALLILSVTPVFASVLSDNVVRFSDGVAIETAVSSSLTVNLIGENFSQAPDAAGFSLAWNPAVLEYFGTSIANPPWDTSTLGEFSVESGLLDFVFLGKSVGNAGSNFDIATFTFTVLGNIGDSSFLTISDAFGGFVRPGGLPISANYISSQVQVVPIPTAVWLFGTGFLGLLGLKKRSQA